MTNNTAKVICTKLLGHPKPYALYVDGKLIGEYRTDKQVEQRMTQLGVTQVEWIGY